MKEKKKKQANLNKNNKCPSIYALSLNHVFEGVAVWKMVALEAMGAVGGSGCRKPVHRAKDLVAAVAFQGETGDWLGLH